MANTLNTQILLDGPRNTVVKLQGILDTSDLTSTTVVNLSSLLPTDGYTNRTASSVRIDKIVYDVEDALEVRLSWDASTPVVIWDLVGRGKVDMRHEGGLTNNAGAGKTGNILLQTQGWSTGAILSFTVVLDLVKR